MKGKLQATSPQRQFENIKKTYYFDSIDEELEAEKKMKEWLIEAHHEVSRMANPTIPLRVRTSLEKIDGKMYEVRHFPDGSNEKREIKK